MELTLGQIFSAANVFAKLGARENPIAVAYKIHGIMKMLEKDLTFFETERQKIVADNTVDGVVNHDEANKKFSEMVAIKADLPIVPLPLSLVQNFRLTITELADIEKFIVDDGK